VAISLHAFFDSLKNCLDSSFGFLVSWAQNMDQEEYFALNRLGISIFDYSGQLIAVKMLPGSTG